MRSQDPFFRRYSNQGSSSSKWKRRLGIILSLIVLSLFAILVYKIPFVNDHLAWRVDEWRTRLIYFLNPPEEAAFVPQEAQNLAASATALALQTTRTPLAPTPTEQPTRLPLPNSVRLENFTYIDQHGRWNYCGPANLTMALNYWGWQVTRDDVAAYVKPGIGNVPNSPEDKNVMPYELEDFVETQTEGMQAVVRIGGELETLKQLVAAGFPAMVEKGYYTTDASGNYAWLGHYQFVTGYDDGADVFIVQDTYQTGGENGTGQNMTWPYADFETAWRAFDFLFLVVYPENQQDALVQALGPWADEEWANRHALERAMEDGETLTGVDQFYAWFNIGSSHVRLFEYVDAAFAYDYAFQLYAALPEDDSVRPYRMLWYQTGPYWAYYYSGRYQDVINLANTTLYDTIAEPTLEESIYWRGLAFEALGQIDNAIADYREAVRLNPNFVPGWAQLQRLGLSG